MKSVREKVLSSSLIYERAGKGGKQIERCVIATFRAAERIGFKGECRQWGGPTADRRLITVRTSDPNLSHVEREISRDFAAQQTECDERILRQDGRHDLFSATAKGPAPCSFTTQVS